MTYIKLLTTKELGLYGGFSILITQAFGEWSPAMTLLVILMGSDYLTGLLASLKEGKGLKSSVSFWGLVRKGLMMLSVLIAHHIDIVMSTNVVMIGTIYFWYGNESISLIENYGRMGLPLPDPIKNKIAVLKGKPIDEKKSKNK
ncbi:holin family protein [Paenibacillus sp. GCM10027627]|uniref:phage holin family protein n=1 Tax=unclassified Paenibacillus TaxID=185978 RepID=UPI003640C10C